MKEILSDVFKKQGIEADVSDFLTFSDMLLKTNEVMNLTAITDPREVAIRHFADSLALLRVSDMRNMRVIDVGCGAGFPGLPMKLGEKSIRLTLLDALRKRIDFLNDVCASLCLDNVECIHARAEELAAKKDYRASFDVAVSRAVADLSMLSELCLPFVKTGGIFIAMKAQNCEEELALAENAISILGAKLESRVDYPLYDTGITHTALIFRKVSETPQKYPRRFAKIKSQPL